MFDLLPAASVPAPHARVATKFARDLPVYYLADCRQIKVQHGGRKEGRKEVLTGEINISTPSMGKNGIFTLRQAETTR